MKRIALLLASAVMLAAQAIPGRYVVVLKNEPAAAVSIRKGVRYSTADRDVVERKTQIQGEHARRSNPRFAARAER